MEQPVARAPSADHTLEDVYLKLLQNVITATKVIK
jgi:hypothetical protein